MTEQNLNQDGVEAACAAFYNAEMTDWNRLVKADLLLANEYRKRMRAALSAFFELFTKMQAEVIEHHTQVREARAWQEGVDTALNHAILNPDGITLRLEHLDGRPWANPYRKESSDGR